jgi:hypothetical protein
VARHLGLLVARVDPLVEPACRGESGPPARGPPAGAADPGDLGQAGHSGQRVPAAGGEDRPDGQAGDYIATILQSDP